MAGSEFGHKAAPGDSARVARVARYRRTLREVADHRAVDEAEDVLARSWVAQLDEMRRTALSLVATSRMAGNAARAEVRLAAERGRPMELALAQARLDSLERAQEGNVREARAFIESVDAELELVCQAGIERARRDRADHARLRAAWQAAYGKDAAEQDAAAAQDVSGQDVTGHDVTGHDVNGRGVNGRGADGQGA